MTETPTPSSQPSNAGQPVANDVGSILKQARTRRGQSFEVVFQHTRIPKKFLEALEANRFDEFPATVYLHGFLKSYCEHLDLEFEPLWSQVRPSQVSTKQEPVPEVHQAPITPAENAQVLEEVVDAVRSPAPRPRAAPAPTPVYMPIVFAVVAVLALLTGLFWALPKNTPKPPPPPPLVQHPIEPLAPVVLPPQKMTLKLSFHNEAWLSLRCDGKLRFEGRGPAGFGQTWTAMKDFSIRTSNPEDLVLDLDGKEVRLDPATKTSSGEYVIKRP